MQSTENKRTMLNCDVSKETRTKMNEHIAKLGIFQYRFINEAILEKIKRDSDKNIDHKLPVKKKLPKTNAGRVYG